MGVAPGGAGGAGVAGNFARLRPAARAMPV